MSKLKFLNVWLTHVFAENQKVGKRETVISQIWKAEESKWRLPHLGITTSTWVADAVFSCFALSTATNLLQLISGRLINQILHIPEKKNSNHPKKIHKTNISEIIEKDLIEDPEGVIIGSAKELVEGSRVVNVDLSVVNEVFAHIFSIIRPRVHR